MATTAGATGTSRRARHRGAQVGWLGMAAVLLLAAISAAATVTYTYDELGRLVGVVDPAGQTATYRYDPAGNLTAIAVNATIVTIVNFAPSCGAAGTTVTVAGVGFAATPGGNAVRFNGVPAAVGQASPTRLLVTVPAGNTTGPITVTTGSGTATSASAFRGTCVPPTITGFSPTSGVAPTETTPGTQVIVTGTGFQSNPADNVVTFGVSRAVVTQASPTSLTTSVPEAAASGPISLATPFGRAKSAQDFFVIPVSHAIADVDTATRSAVGQTATVTITAPSHIAIVLFEGKQGQRISVLATPATWRLQLVGPYGPIDAAYPPCGSNPGAVRPTTLPVSGTYAIVVDDPGATSTGQVSISVYEVTDVTAPIVTRRPFTVTTSTPGQNTRLEFAAVAGWRLSVQVTAGTLTCCNSYASIISPDGGFLHDPVRVDGGGFVDARVVPVRGTYTLLLEPGPNAGTQTVVVFRLPREKARKTALGFTTGFGLKRPGQNARFTFNGGAGQRLRLRRTFDTFPPGTVDVFIANPDGSPLLAPTAGDPGVIVLPQSGTYTMLVDPIGASTGLMKLQLQDCSSDPC